MIYLPLIDAGCVSTNSDWPVMPTTTKDWPLSMYGPVDEGAGYGDGANFGSGRIGNGQSHRHMDYTENASLDWLYMKDATYANVRHVCDQPISTPSLVAIVANIYLAAHTTMYQPKEIA